MAFRPLEEDNGLFVEAIGAALIAAEKRQKPPLLEALVAPGKEASLE
jgi:hypothetical protein